MIGEYATMGSVGIVLDVGTIIAAVWAFSAMRTEVTELRRQVGSMQKCITGLNNSLGIISTDIAVVKQAVRDHTEAEI